jgi:predicted secreted protein
VSAVGVVVFFVIAWWVVLFTTLPFGVRRDADPEPGSDAGAPEKPRMVAKALATTAIAVTITAAVYFAAEAGLLPLREWLSPGTRPLARPN